MRQECEDNWVQTDISTLKMVLMRDDLPESRCGVKHASVAPRVCLIDDRHLSHNENSESMDNAT